MIFNRSSINLLEAQVPYVKRGGYLLLNQLTNPSDKIPSDYSAETLTD
jgi:hypothetical protein